MPCLIIKTLDVFCELGWIYHTKGDPIQGWPSLKRIQKALKAPAYASVSTASGTPMTNDKWTLYDYNMTYILSEIVITWENKYLPTEKIKYTKNPFLDEILGEGNSDDNMLEVLMLVKKLGLNGVTGGR